MRNLLKLSSLLITLLLSVTTVKGSDCFITADSAVTVNNWTYKLQGSAAENWELLPEVLAAAPHDLLVTDFARFGDEDSKFTPLEVSRIEHSYSDWGGDGHRKVVLAYISIGEASDFRSYWNPAWTDDGTASGNLTGDAPEWLGPVDPDWPESRKVRYWMTGWQDIIFNDSGTGWLDQVVAQGFDGAYLDIIDAYYFWFEQGELSELDAAQRMIDFVVAISQHARQTNPSFIIFPQNEPGILDVVKIADPQRYAAYVAAINGIGVEDTYFFGDADENNPYNPQQFIIQKLKDDFLANGLPVFTVDYVNTTNKVQQFYTVAVSDGFYPYAAPTRDLDEIGPVGPGIPLPPENDCNTNGVPDDCDIASGTSLDANGNGIPDECETSCLGDLDGDNDVDQADLGLLLASYLLDAGGDLDGDGDTDQADLGILLAGYDQPC